MGVRVKILILRVWKMTITQFITEILVRQIYLAKKSILRTADRMGSMEDGDYFNKLPKTFLSDLIRY